MVGTPFTAAEAATKRKISLSALLDYFIPRELQVQPDAHRRARMFMLSHAFGPFLGNVIPLYLHFVLKIQADYRFWTFFGSIMMFWVYPFLLRTTKRYQLIAFISVQNLIFCILWACYAYGGINSPFLSWALIIPLLSFFYLPATGMIRNILLVQIFASVGFFGWLVISGFRFPYADLSQFQFIGIISTFSASLYVVMMALYFANIFKEQGAFERELGSLVASADHLLNITAAAQQATLAKANFIASMSHELRTPLNAVIGYSQILLDDADEQDDQNFAEDVIRIQSAGCHLLRLVNDILDFSKIEAGKMDSQPALGTVSKQMLSIISEASQNLSNGHTLDHHFECADTLYLDWNNLAKAVQHLVGGICENTAGGVIKISALVENQHLEIRVTDPEVREEVVASETLFDVFSDDCDDSSTKYGGVGIAYALSLKFAQFVGGDIRVENDSSGRRTFVMTIPTASEPAEIKAAA